MGESSELRGILSNRRLRTYALNLSKTLAEEEKNPDRAKILRNLVAK